MSATRLAGDELAERAGKAASNAARLAEVTARSLTENDDLEALGRLLSDIWLADGSEPLMTPTMSRALIHSGNYVSGAFAGDQLVGASVGFLGAEDERLFLHSHITGVAVSMQGRSLGFALKQHQRAWALERGIDSITWTFDPLVRRNAYFNVAKLGADIVDYKPNFYGVMRDGINGDDPTDRCVVHWKLADIRASEAATGQVQQPQIDGDTSSILQASPDEEPELSLRLAPILLASIPSDIVEIRHTDPPKAAAWRAVLREACEWAFLEGYSITGMTRAGAYVFTATA